ncbi:hypothetical protein C7M61_005276 [Candidozyma pseudohaemuli]|uniref:Major facilitator superfamily (MFS) profile domain-containing protein n=1 Tax=Candidozyma pseudohaemuli TaxID=418784 RepID=A0A2P7YCH5_9ASCO|nr:hypothetical protein C7M61_005276 [[Candida] pseudohaemulonii]PSK33666.1 hypothetical protein C7M61_005276 [[Candida] pseudohaemulonii]
MHGKFKLEKIKEQFKPTPIEEIVGKAIAEALPDHGKPWFMVKHLLLLNILLIVPLLSAAVNGYDGSLMNGLQSMEEWRDQFGHPQGTMLGFVNAAQSIGGVIVLPFAGYLADKLGRKLTLTIGLVGIIVATIIQATGHNLGQLIASRFIVGFAGLLAVQPAPLLVAELSYPTMRGKITCLYFTLFYVGAILAAWSCYGCTGRGDAWAWRIPTILQAAFPIIQLVFLYFVPESPRWLVSKGKVDKARDILVRFHGGGDVHSPLVETEMIEISNALDMERQADQTTWMAFISTPGNRKRAFIAITMGIFSQWSGNAVVSYYFTLVLDTIGITSSSMQTLINGFLQIFNFVFATLGAFSVDFFGRRFLLLWSGIGMLISYIIWTICSAIFDQTKSVSAGRAVVGFIFIFFFHYDIAYTPLLIGYPTEIFPYSMRSKGVSLVLATTSASLVISSFCNSIAMDNIGWRYYIVFCVILLFAVLNTYFFYPETKGYSLEEIAVLFDGEKVTDLEILLAEDDDHLDSLLSGKKDIQVEHLETVSGSSRGSR